MHGLSGVIKSRFCASLSILARGDVLADLLSIWRWECYRQLELQFEEGMSGQKAYWGEAWL